MAESNSDIVPAVNMVVERVTAEDGITYRIDAYAVVDSGDDAATSSRQRPSVLRRLGHDPDFEVVAASQAGLSQGRPPPEGAEDALVVLHCGDILSDNRNIYSWIGAFGYLFLEGCGGPLDTTRRTSVLFV